MHVISIERALAEAGSATRAAARLQRVAAWNERRAAVRDNPRGTTWQRRDGERTRKRLADQAAALRAGAASLSGQYERMAA
ncbi:MULTISPECIES: hypothetical protein [unclassified Chelatococcus]|mgnify:CR=1 FL=1|uniref:hypothetical protein n=1 Tax=unclassified Chelatococcus TaxID=2638111 RepID=UPI001BD16EC1|nr:MULTISPECIES: hypothetical protein [unclassified Chelatococcus]MBS7697849.1 hypothetical protein [Chelatococcus sp. YT9]MBX3559796.1 hypothetical protein [Chelatococcus sp.]